MINAICLKHEKCAKRQTSLVLIATVLLALGCSSPTPTLCSKRPRKSDFQGNLIPFDGPGESSHEFESKYFALNDPYQFPRYGGAPFCRQHASMQLEDYIDFAEVFFEESQSAQALHCLHLASHFAETGFEKAVVYANIGTVLAKTNHLDDAYRHFELSLQFYEHDEGINVRAATLLCERVGWAAKDCEKYLLNKLEKFPASSELHLLLSKMYIFSKQPVMALESFSRTSTNASEAFEALYGPQILFRFYDQCDHAASVANTLAQAAIVLPSPTHMNAAEMLHPYLQDSLGLSSAHWSLRSLEAPPQSIMHLTNVGAGFFQSIDVQRECRQSEQAFQHLKTAAKLHSSNSWAKVQNAVAMAEKYLLFRRCAEAKEKCHVALQLIKTLHVECDMHKRIIIEFKRKISFIQGMCLIDEGSPEQGFEELFSSQQMMMRMIDYHKYPTTMFQEALQAIVLAHDGSFHDVERAMIDRILDNILDISLSKRVIKDGVPAEMPTLGRLGCFLPARMATRLCEISLPQLSRLIEQCVSGELFHESSRLVSTISFPETLPQFKKTLEYIWIGGLASLSGNFLQSGLLGKIAGESSLFFVSEVFKNSDISGVPQLAKLANGMSIQKSGIQFFPPNFPRGFSAIYNKSGRMYNCTGVPMEPVYRWIRATLPSRIVIHTQLPQASQLTAMAPISTLAPVHLGLTNPPIPFGRPPRLTKETFPWVHTVTDSVTWPVDIHNVSSRVAFVGNTAFNSQFIKVKAKFSNPPPPADVKPANEDAEKWFRPVSKKHLLENLNYFASDENPAFVIGFHGTAADMPADIINQLVRKLREFKRMTLIWFIHRQDSGSSLYAFNALQDLFSDDMNFLVQIVVHLDKQLPPVQQWYSAADVWMDAGTCREEFFGLMSRAAPTVTFQRSMPQFRCSSAFMKRMYDEGCKSCLRSIVNRPDTFVDTVLDIAQDSKARNKLHSEMKKALPALMGKSAIVRNSRRVRKVSHLAYDAAVLTGRDSKASEGNPPFHIIAA